MGYMIGQITNVNVTKFSNIIIENNQGTDISIDNEYDLQSLNSVNTFKQKSIQGNFQANLVYNITYTIQQPINDKEYPNGITLDVLLANEDKDIIQKISRVNIPLNSTNENKSTTGTLFFIPIKTGTQIIFKMLRGFIDFDNQHKEKGREWTTYFNTCTIKQLVNIITDNKSFKRIGFQSRPGTQIVVNNAPMKVGRSGILQLNIGVDITSLMIAENNNGQIDPFLLDYIYYQS